MGYERAAETYGRGDQQSISRIAMLQMMQAIGTGCRRVVERYCFEPGPIEEP